MPKVGLLIFQFWTPHFNICRLDSTFSLHSTLGCQTSVTIMHSFRRNITTVDGYSKTRNSVVADKPRDAFVQMQ